MKKLISLIFVLSLNLFGATLEQAQHRLPPVIYSLDIPKYVMPDVYTDFKWTVMGYHDTYDIIINVYDENGNKIATDKVSPYKETKGQYHYENIQSKRFWYKTSLSLPFYSNQDLIIRFFASPPNDNIDTNFLSCLVPGGLGYEVADTTGRKIKIKGQIQSNEYYLDLPYSGSYKVTQGNNDTSNSHYDHGTWDNTYAIDFATPLNTEILAPADGKIVCLYDEKHNGGTECGFKASNGCLGGGRVMVLKDNYGNYLTFLHLSSFNKNIGDVVNRGDIIAYSGKSKGSNGTCSDTASIHLHFHLWNGKGSPDSHTTAFTKNTKLRVKIDDEIKYLYGNDLDDSKIYQKIFKSLQ